MRDIIPIQKPTPNPSPKNEEEIFYSPPKKNLPSPPPQVVKPRRWPKFKSFFSWLIILLLFAGMSYGLFFLYKVYALSKKISIEVNAQTDTSLLKTLTTIATGDTTQLKSQDDRINILLLGMAGVGRAGTNLTDTIMVASLNTKTKQVALLSIPRDLFVSIPNLNAQMKINSVYQYGLANADKDQGEAAKVIAQTVEDITSLPINYYVILNFAGFEKIIDSLDGINIISDLEIHDPRYPGPNFSYENFELSKGFHHLDGATALKYVRERHNDPEGDFGRAKRQQQVLQSTKNKVFSVGTLLNPFKLTELFNALGDNIITNINPDEMVSFIELTKKLDTQNINNMVIDAWNKDSLLKVSHVFYGDLRSFVLVPRVGNWSEVQDLAKNIFDLNSLNRQKDEIQKEDARVLIINQSGNSLLPQKIQKLLAENLNYKNVSLLNIPSKNTTEHSLAYDLTNGTKPFTLNEIATKLPTTTSYDASALQEALKNNQADIVIVIGKDLIARYTIEEDTLDDLNNARDNEEQLNILQNKN